VVLAYEDKNFINRTGQKTQKWNHVVIGIQRKCKKMAQEQLNIYISNTQIKPSPIAPTIHKN
jgi:hypothetical protein